jgi:lipid-binding SYLF domain-containing protein
MSKIFAAAALALGFGACSHMSTPSPTEQADLEAKSNAALNNIRQHQPGIDPLLHSAAAYAVFPKVGEAGAIVGGAFGKGVLYQQGNVIGFVQLKQGSIGFTFGGKTYSELLVLRAQQDIDRLRAGKFEVGGNVSAVVIKTGAEAAGSLDPNTTVIVLPMEGLMAEVAVSGQKIEYAPAG